MSGTHIRAELRGLGVLPFVAQEELPKNTTNPQARKRMAEMAEEYKRYLSPLVGAEITFRHLSNLSLAEVQTPLKITIGPQEQKAAE